MQSGRHILPRLLAAFSCAVLAATPSFAWAGNVTWPQDTDLVLSGSGITLEIAAGSEADAFSVTATSFTVTVAAGESFTVRSPGPSPILLSNDGGIDDCDLSGDDNVATADGPATVTFTPVSTACTGGSGGGGSSGATMPSVKVSEPNGHERYDEGAPIGIWWTMNGTAVKGVRVTLWSDAGTRYLGMLHEGAHGIGYATVTASGSSTDMWVKVEALGDGGAVLAADTSDAAFTIAGRPVITPPPEAAPDPAPAPIPPAPTAPLADTPPETETPACAREIEFTQFLIRGAGGSQVLPLQELLRCLGHFPDDIEPNGYFGPATQQAVRAFQAAHGIEPVGYVGPGTRAALNGYGATTAPKSVAALKTCAREADFTAFLTRGVIGGEVIPLQRLLQCLGHLPEDVSLNGVYGPATERAVRGFQADNGIDVRGYVGPMTRRALNAIPEG